MDDKKKSTPACLWWGPVFFCLIQPIKVGRGISTLSANSKIAEYFHRGISNLRTMFNCGLRFLVGPYSLKIRCVANCMPVCSGGLSRAIFCQTMSN